MYAFATETLVVLVYGTVSEDFHEALLAAEPKLCLDWMGSRLAVNILLNMPYHLS